MSQTRPRRSFDGLPPNHPRVLLRQLEQRARRRFGQHFLMRDDIIHGIVRGARVRSGDRVLEIGPGLGVLTRALIDAGADVTAVELDRDLAQFLRENLPMVRLIEADALRVNWSETCPGEGWRVAANLPYNVGTTVTLDLLHHPKRFRSITVMLQREVVDRMVALPGSKVYGSLSVSVQVRAAAHPVLPVPPDAFFPRPKVQSMVVRLEPYETPQVGDVSYRGFERMVRAAFQQRRKTVLNSLSSLYGRDPVAAALQVAGVQSSQRAEQLGLDALRAIAGALSQMLGGEGDPLLTATPPVRKEVPGLD